MKKIQNDCVNCGFPCQGAFCRYKNIPHYYCDECGDETTLYEFENELELCKDCLLNKFDIIEGSK